MGDSSSAPGGAVSSGALRTKISIKFAGGETMESGYRVVAPFYTMNPEVPQESCLLGSNDLLETFDLSQIYQRFVGGPKRMREDLGSFLPNLYGNFNFAQAQEFSSLKRLVEKPPITGKEIVPLTPSAMSGFRLNPGPVDERYRYVFENRRDNQIPGTLAYDEGNPSRKYKRPFTPVETEAEGKRRRDENMRKHEKKRRKKEKKKREREGRDGSESHSRNSNEDDMDQL